MTFSPTSRARRATPPRLLARHAVEASPRAGALGTVRRLLPPRSALKAAWPIVVVEVVEVLLRRAGMSLTASSERGRRRQVRCRLLAWRQAERLERLVRERLRRPSRPKEKAPRHARRPQSEEVIWWYPNETHDET